MSKIIGGKYEMEYKPEKEIFLLKILGSYSKEDARVFFTHYDRLTKNFDADNTSIVVDCSNLSTIDSEFKSILVNVIKLFMELGYKYRIFLKSESPKCDSIIKTTMNEAKMVYGKDAILLDGMTAVNQLITM